MITCSKCGNKFEAQYGRGYRCIPCVRATAREHYHSKPHHAVNKEAKRLAHHVNKTDPVKYAKMTARSQLRAAVRRGKVTRLPCEVCGIPKVEAHHTDYSKPLEVQWLCLPHHREIHRKEG